MEAASKEENQNQNNEENNNNNNNNNNSNSNGKINNNNNSSEGQSKPKRQMKTQFQLETLEKAYSMETYPSEATRADLGCGCELIFLAWVVVGFILVVVGWL